MVGSLPSDELGKPYTQPVGTMQSKTLWSQFKDLVDFLRTQVTRTRVRKTNGAVTEENITVMRNSPGWPGGIPGNCGGGFSLSDGVI